MSFNGEETYGLNKRDFASPENNHISIDQGSIVSEDSLSQDLPTSFIPPSPYSYYPAKPLTTFNYDGSSSNSSVSNVSGGSNVQNVSVMNTSNFPASMSSPAPPKGLPPASELLSLNGHGSSSTRGVVGMPPDSRQHGQGSSTSGFLPSISSLGQKPTNPHFYQQQPQPSPSIPPSPYLNTPSTYYCITEPGTPATQIFNPLDHHQVASPSVSVNFHSSNPPSLISSVSQSPVSISNFQRSPSSKSIRLNSSSTPDYSSQPSSCFPSVQQQLHASQEMNSSSQPPKQNLTSSGSTKSTRAPKSVNYRSGRAKNAAFASMLQLRGATGVPFGDDGPTVKEHLQLQQARQRIMQQQESQGSSSVPERKGRRGNSKSSSTSNSPQKSFFLQPLPQQNQPQQQLQHQQLGASSQASDISPSSSTSSINNNASNNNYDRFAPTRHASTLICSPGGSSTYAAAPPPPQSSSNTMFSSSTPATATSRRRLISHFGSRGSNSISPHPIGAFDSNKFQEDEAQRKFSLNDALASTIASVASGVSGSLDPEDLLDSSIELNSPYRTPPQDEDMLEEAHTGHGERETEQMQFYAATTAGSGNKQSGSYAVQYFNGRSASTTSMLAQQNQLEEIVPSKLGTNSKVNNSRGTKRSNPGAAKHRQVLALSSGLPAKRCSQLPSNSLSQEQIGGGYAFSQQEKSPNIPTMDLPREYSGRQSASSSASQNFPTSADVVGNINSADRTSAYVFDQNHQQQQIHQQQQCTRIRVQNPPNALGGCSFPPTETTIHVVQQPRYQGSSSRYSAPNSGPQKQQSGSSRNNSSIVSVQQHPSVTLIQQQQDTMESDRIRHIIVQQQNLQQRQRNSYSQNTGDGNCAQQVGPFLGSSSGGMLIQEYLPPRSQYPLQQLEQQRDMTNLDVCDNSLIAALQQPLQQQNQQLIDSPPPYHLAVQGDKINISNAAAAAQQQDSEPSIFLDCPAPSHHLISQTPQLLAQTQSLLESNELNTTAYNRMSDEERREFQKYSTKYYHLQRTVKSLVYKNGALADELARLNQRIQTVTDERRMLSKRLQHHERNRIRRIQAQKRKKAAKLAADARKVVNEFIKDFPKDATESTTTVNSVPNESHSLILENLSLLSTENGDVSTNAGGEVSNVSTMNYGTVDAVDCRDDENSDTKGADTLKMEKNSSRREAVTEIKPIRIKTLDSDNAIHSDVTNFFSQNCKSHHNSPTHLSSKIKKQSPTYISVNAIKIEHNLVESKSRPADYETELKLNLARDDTKHFASEFSNKTPVTSSGGGFSMSLRRRAGSFTPSEAEKLSEKSTLKDPTIIASPRDSLLAAFNGMTSGRFRAGNSTQHQSNVKRSGNVMIKNYSKADETEMFFNSEFPSISTTNCSYGAEQSEQQKQQRRTIRLQQEKRRNRLRKQENRGKGNNKPAVIGVSEANKDYGTSRGAHGATARHSARQLQIKHQQQQHHEEGPLIAEGRKKLLRRSSSRNSSATSSANMALLTVNCNVITSSSTQENGVSPRTRSTSRRMSSIVKDNTDNSRNIQENISVQKRRSASTSRKASSRNDGENGGSDERAYIGSPDKAIKRNSPESPIADKARKKDIIDNLNEAVAIGVDEAAEASGATASGSHSLEESDGEEEESDGGENDDDYHNEDDEGEDDDEEEDWNEEKRCLYSLRKLSALKRKQRLSGLSALTVRAKCVKTSTHDQNDQLFAKPTLPSTEATLPTSLQTII